MGWFLRFLLLLIIIRLLWRLAAGILEGLRSRDAVPERGVTMVRDPVCGTFVVRNRALTGGQGDRVHYFCSETCRKAFEAR
jgi:YHS domain-containing protein